MNPEQQAAEIEKLKQQICSQDIELKHLRSTNDLNSAWKHVCEQKDKTIDYQQRELDKSIKAAGEQAVENQKLRRDLCLQDIEIKKLLANDEINVDWKAICNERSIVNKQQQQILQFMESENDAAKEFKTDHWVLRGEHEHLQQKYRLLRQKHESLQQEHISLLQDHTSLQQNHNDLEEEKTKSVKKIQDLEARLDATTSAPSIEIPSRPRHGSQVNLTPSRARRSSPRRTLEIVLARVSNRDELPPVVITYLKTQFFSTATSLGRIDDFRFSLLTLETVPGVVCLQRQANSGAAIVHIYRDGACEDCVSAKRICVQKDSIYPVVVFPLPKNLRSGKRVEELGYWVQGM